jgi:phosphotriesterase-related protein
MAKKVITVLGPVSPEELGITDGHNHVWISQQKAPAENAPVLNQPDKILAELKAYRQLGGGSQVDCQPGGCGRDGNKLKWLSEQSGVHVIASTGLHLQEYYPPDAEIWQMDTDQATHYFLDEIENGLMETRRDNRPVFPGLIKIAVRESLNESPLHLVEAAVQASKQTGYLLEMHTQKGQSVEEFLEFIQGFGLPEDRLVICHIDKRPDLGLHQELAQAGYLLEYDTFFRPKYQPEKHLWPLIEGMVAHGYGKNMVLATDLADGSLWKEFGGSSGISSFVTVVKRRLEGMAFSANCILEMVGGNIARGLAI